MEIDYSSAGLWALMAATFILATTHTVSPDHWFPFVMVGKANKWKLSWVLGLAMFAGIGHVGTSVVIGLVGVFAEKGASKEIATFLENTTPILLMVFGFGYAAYALYKQRVGAHGHSHGIPIINKWLGIDPHAYELPGHEHHHEPGQISRNGLHLGKVDLYLHNMDLHIRIAHDDHIHDYDATKDENHVHEHKHCEVVHDHKHQHQASGANSHTHGGHGHTHDIHGHDHGEHIHSHEEHEHRHEVHSHDNGEHGHTHEHHDHGNTHDHHQHDKPKTDLSNKRAGWGLVAILGLTPCIALLPLTFAAVKYGTMAIILVNVCFAVATIGTIMLFTWLGLMGLSWIKLEFFDEYGDIIAGVIIGLLGLATKVFEL